MEASTRSVRFTTGFMWVASVPFQPFNAPTPPLLSVEAQTQRDADGAALAGHRLVLGQKLLLVGVEVQAVVGTLAGHRLIAAVAGDVLAAIRKGVDGKLAVVAAAAALDADDFLVEALQL